MATTLPIPPTGTPVFDANGIMTETWRRYFLSLENLGPDIPPIDAQYWLSQANTELPNERNLGALASGYLKIAVAGATATPSTVTTIPGSDITGAALTTNNDTNVTLSAGGTPSTALLRAASLTVGWTGLLGLNRGGTHTDLSLTGGTSKVLQQLSAGGDITVEQLTTADISGITVSSYTPTLTGVANVDASTAFLTNYIRIGACVVVFGKLAVDPTANATFTDLGISLPIASAFTNPEQCGGSANAGALQQGAAITADITNDRATMSFLSTTNANATMAFIFGYVIV